MNRPLDPAASDPFVLEGAYIRLDQLVALHRFAARLSLSARRQSGSMLAGEWRTHQRGRGIDFDQVRAYQAGDDIRSIDWRVTARRQAPHTRVYREERERPVLLAADLRSPMFFGSRHCFKAVLASALIGTLGWIALAGRDRVGGLVFGDQEHRDLRPRRSRHSVLELLQQLDAFSHRLTTPCPAEAPAPLSQLLDKLLHTSHPGTAVYIASDFHDLDDASEQRFYQLARHSDLTLFLISDPLEYSLPDSDDLWIGNGRQRTAVRDLHRPGERLAQRDQRLRELCTRLAIPLHHLGTEQSPLPLLQQLYGSRSGARGRA
jgi:uncharacterized protein (DUF58 family)